MITIKEYREYHAKTDQKKRRAGRNKARREMEAVGAVRKGDGKDVDHKDRNPLNSGKTNLRITTASKNRGWRKGKKGRLI